MSFSSPFFVNSQLSVDEVRERQQRLSKMRSLLFQHEAKSKRVAKIKSKIFRRLDKSKKMRDFMETDEEAIKEAALKQEEKRAEVCHIFLSCVISHNMFFLDAFKLWLLRRFMEQNHANYLCVVIVCLIYLIGINTVGQLTA